MRRILVSLAVVSLLCSSLVVSAGCGSGLGKTTSSPDSPRQLVSLDGFTLRPGQSYRVTFAVDAPKLRIVACVRGAGGPAPGAGPSLHCELSRVEASGATPVTLDVNEHARSATGEAFWIYAAQSGSPLAAGTYRLTLSGDGRLQPFSVDQL